MTGNVAWITHSMLHDQFADETKMYCHLIGGAIQGINAKLRSPSVLTPGAPHPMIDLWSRIPAYCASYDIKTHVAATKKRQRVTGERPYATVGFEGQHVAYDD